MAFLSLTSAQCDADSVGDETLFQLIRTNLDDLDTRLQSVQSTSDQDIRDDFVNDLVIDSDNWVTSVSGAGTATVVAEHKLQLVAGTAVNHAIAGAATKKQRIAFSQEYVAIMEFRAKRATGSDSESLIGYQDNALNGGTLDVTYVTDRTDGVFFWLDNSDTQWRCRVVSGGTASETTGLGTATSWTKFKLIVTCSATAGSRKVQAYVNDVEISGSPFTSNLTTQTLRPIAGTSGGGEAPTLTVDYCLAYFQNRPLSA